MVKLFETSDKYIANKVKYLLDESQVYIYENNNTYDIYIDSEYATEALSIICKYHELEPLNLLFIDYYGNKMPIGYFPFLNIYYDEYYSKEDAEAWNIKMDIRHNPREIRSFLSMLKEKIDNLNTLVNFDYPKMCLNVYLHLLDTTRFDEYKEIVLEYSERYSYVFPKIDLIEVNNIDGSIYSVIPNDKERLIREKEERLKALKLKN